MPYLTREKALSGPAIQPTPCRCVHPPITGEERRRGVLWKIQVTSVCRLHWPMMTWGQKVRILFNEGYRFGDDA